jgi:hypothetical protein
LLLHLIFDIFSKKGHTGKRLHCETEKFLVLTFEGIKSMKAADERLGEVNA